MITEETYNLQQELKLQGAVWGKDWYGLRGVHLCIYS